MCKEVISEWGVVWSEEKNLPLNNADAQTLPKSSWNKTKIHIFFMLLMHCMYYPLFFWPSEQDFQVADRASTHCEWQPQHLLCCRRGRIVLMAQSVSQVCRWQMGLLNLLLFNPNRRRKIIPQKWLPSIKPRWMLRKCASVCCDAGEQLSRTPDVFATSVSALTNTYKCSLLICLPQTSVGSFQLQYRLFATTKLKKVRG